MITLSLPVRTVPTLRFGASDNLILFVLTDVRKTLRMVNECVCHGLIAVMVTVVAVVSYIIGEDMSHTIHPLSV